MPNQPRDTNPARAVRVEDSLWKAAQAKAAERGETVSDVIRRALQRVTADTEALLPLCPRCRRPVQLWTDLNREAQAECSGCGWQTEVHL